MSENATKKQSFVAEYDYKQQLGIRCIILAIQKPNGAIEIIVKRDELEDEFQYIISTYDKDMLKYDNMQIKILDWMII